MLAGAPVGQPTSGPRACCLLVVMKNPSACALGLGVSGPASGPRLGAAAGGYPKSSSSGLAASYGPRRPMPAGPGPGRPAACLWAGAPHACLPFGVAGAQGYEEPLGSAPARRACSTATAWGPALRAACSHGPRRPMPAGGLCWGRGPRALCLLVGPPRRRPSTARPAPRLLDDHGARQPACGPWRDAYACGPLQASHVCLWGPLAGVKPLALPHAPVRLR